MNHFLKWWKKNVFRIMVISSIIGLFLLYLYNDESEGTYSTELDSFQIDPIYSYQPKKKAFSSDSKGETICRLYLERTFKKSFPNTRPEFLKNAVTGRALEIDCCNYELMLGVEYNGKQHYEYVPGMHRNHEAFQTQQYRDHLKKEMCAKNNFTLISVPYTIPLDSIENYLREELHKKGFQI